MKTLRRLGRWMAAIALAGGWTAFASAVYVVRTGDVNGWPRATIVPKARLGFSGTYVDVRQWQSGDAANHPDVVLRLIEAGKLDALPNGAAAAPQIGVAAADVDSAAAAMATSQPAAAAGTASPHERHRSNHDTL